MKTMRLFISFTLLVVCIFNSQAQTITVSNNSPILVGNTLTVSVSTTALVFESMYVFDMQYDASILQFVSADITGTLANGGSLTTDNSTAGIVNMQYLGALTGTGDLVKLTFTAIGSGTSALNIVTYGGFFPNTATIVNGSVTVNNPQYDINSTTQNVLINSNVTLPIQTSALTATDNIKTFSFNIAFDNTILQYLSATVAGTISSAGTVTVTNPSAGVLNVSFTSATPITGSGDMLFIDFKAINNGSSLVSISNVLYNAIAANSITNGRVNVSTPAYNISTTFQTVIQGNFFDVIVSTTNLVPGTTACLFDVIYNENIIQYQGASLTGTLAQGGLVNVNSGVPNRLTVSITRAADISGTGNLLVLRFKAYDEGASPMAFSSITYNAIPVNVITDGNITVKKLYEPQLDSVSVDRNSQKVVLGWKAPTTEAADGYIVYRKVYGVPGVADGASVEITRISGANVITFTDNTTQYGQAQPTLRAETYSLASYYLNTPTDTMYSTAGTEQVSVFLQSANFDKCSNETKLQWTAYKGWGAKLSAYRVWVKIGTQPLTLAGQTTSTQTTFTHSNLAQRDNYTYLIQAVRDDNATASSNQITLLADVQKAPAYINTDYVTVPADGQIDLSFSFDASATIVNYALVRSNESGSDSDTIQRFTSPSSPITYTENVPTDIIYAYNLAAVNGCGKLVAESNIVNNIVLTSDVSKSQEGQNGLDWAAVIGWRGQVEGYNIYRAPSATKTYTLLETVSSNTVAYTDDVSALMSTDEGRNGFCYYVEATETGNPYITGAKQRSNEVCIILSPKPFVPNAFNPNSRVRGGINSIFKPTIFSPIDYKMIIYNRWGEPIFETSDINTGWDGTVNGKLAERGMYAYYITYQNELSQKVELRDFLMLIYQDKD